MKAIAKIVSAALCASVAHGQDPEVRQVGTVSIVVTSQDQSAFADRVEKVVGLVGDALEDLGLSLPKGVRLTLHSRTGYDRAARSLGIDPSKVRKTTIYAYASVSDWMPVLHVLAERTGDAEVADSLLMAIAHGLGGLVGITQSRSTVPPISDYGLGGWTEGVYLSSALRNDGTAIPLPQVSEMQAGVLFLVNQQPRRHAREILSKTPANASSLHHTKMFLNVLLHDVPVARRRAVAKGILEWARELSRSLDEKQVQRMERDLVMALRINRTTVKELRLGERMTALGIDKKLHRAPGSLLWAYYDVQLDRMADACEAAKAKKRSDKSAR